MVRRRFKPVKFVSFLKLTDDVDELLELFSQSESLNVQAENELKLRRTERDLIRAKLKKLRNTPSNFRVSDHAIVRYLERVVGLDIEACREEMLSKLPGDLAGANPVQFIKILDGGLQYVVRDNLIISVTPVGEAAKVRLSNKVTGERKASTQASLAKEKPNK